MNGIMPYIYIVLLLLVSAFFSGTEMAYSSLNVLRLKNKAEEGVSLPSKVAYHIYRHFESALSTILISNDLVNTAASAIASVIAISIAGEAGIAWATIVMTIIIITFGEIIPKVISKQHSMSIALFTALPLRLLMIIAKPVVWLVMQLVNLVAKLWKGKIEDTPTVTEGELQDIIEAVEDEGVIDEARSDLLQSALGFDDICAYEIITPRVDMDAIEVDASMDKIMRLISTSSYSRIPVYEETTDNIIGVLHLNLVYKHLVTDKSFNIRDLIMPPCFIHKTTKLPDVLSEFRAKRQHLGIVTDEYGGTMGLLTMEDVLEQLVGDIWDESDEIVDEFVDMGNGSYEVDGNMRIYDFFEELDIDYEDFDDDNATVGGWAIEMIGGFPQRGDSFEYEHITVTVKKIKKRRIMRLLVTSRPRPEEEEDWE